MSITIPEGKLGEKIKAQVIGAKGSRIKLIQEASGSKVILKGQKVLISGGNANLAMEMVRDSIANTISVYVHPSKIVVLLKVSPTQRFKFQPFSSFGGQITYRLTEYNGTDPEVVTAQLANQSYMPYSKHELLQVISQSMPKSSTSTADPQHKYKVELSLGVQTFYHANRQLKLDANLLRRVFTFNSFAATQIGFGKDIKATWNNQITDQQYDELWERLSYFVPISEERQIKCSMVSISKQLRIGMKFKVNQIDAAITPGKVYLDGMIPLYCTILNINEGYDLRFRIIDKGPEVSAWPELSDYINGLNYNPETLQLDSVSDDIRMHYYRTRDKYVFHHPELDLKMTIYRVYDHNEGVGVNYLNISFGLISKDHQLDRLVELNTVVMQLLGISE